MLLLFIIITLAAIAWLYSCSTKNFDYWKKRNIPYIKPIPFFGSFFEVAILRSSIGQKVFEMYNSSKSAVLGFFINNQPVLLIRDPTLVKRIMISDFEYFENRNVYTNDKDKVSSNLLFVLKTPKWRTVRTQITPAYSIGKIKRMLPLIMEVCEEMKIYIGKVKQNQRIDSTELCAKYTTDVIASCGFGINALSFQHENSAFRVALRRLFDWNIFRSISVSAYFVAPMLVKLLNLNFVETGTVDFFRNVFWKHMHERESSNIRRGDLVDTLIELRKSGGLKHLDDDVILAQAVQFFFAGFETTGTAINLTLYCLAKHPKVQQKLRQEVKDVLIRHAEITNDALSDMKYLDAVISETLRMYPILNFLERRCAKDYQIPGTDLILEKGFAVYISLFGLQYDPMYFSEPEKFNPDRFLDGNKDSILPGTYLPFGDGPRNCIGIRFAMMAMKVAVVGILTEFEICTGNTSEKPLSFEPKGVLLTPFNEELDLRFKKLIEVS